MSGAGPQVPRPTLALPSCAVVPRVGNRTFPAPSLSQHSTRCSLHLLCASQDHCHPRGDLAPICGGGRSYQPHITDEQTEAENLDNMPRHHSHDVTISIYHTRETGPEGDRKDTAQELAQQRVGLAGQVQKPRDDP